MASIDRFWIELFLCGSHILTHGLINKRDHPPMVAVPLRRTRARATAFPRGSMVEFLFSYGTRGTRSLRTLPDRLRSAF
jgi:hypothetical protein